MEIRKIISELKEEILNEEIEIDMMDRIIRGSLRSGSTLWSNLHLAVENKSWVYCVKDNENEYEVNVIFEVTDKKFKEDVFYDYELDDLEYVNLKVKVTEIEIL